MHLSVMVLVSSVVQHVDRCRVRRSPQAERLLGRSQVLLLPAVEHLYHPRWHLHRSDMAAVRLPVLPAQGGNRSGGAATEGEAGGPTAAGGHAPRQRQDPELGRRELRHRGKGLGGRTYIRTDNHRQDSREYIDTLRYII